MTPALTELAERVERLTGPCRETDCLIFEAGHRLLTPERRGTIDGEPTGEYFGINGDQLPERAPFYTASLDAAMTLTEPGAEIIISTLYGVARVEYPLNFADHEPYQGEHVGGLIAPAICAAILRAIDGKISARAASENSHGR
jgi:hypothetical protein